MRTLDLYLFVNDNSVEYHWHNDEVLLMVNCRNIEKWAKIVQPVRGGYISDYIFSAKAMHDGRIKKGE